MRTRRHRQSCPLGPHDADASLAMRGASAVGLAPFGPYHWLMYGKEMWFDLTPAQLSSAGRPGTRTDQMFADSYDWFLSRRSRLVADGRASQHRSPAKQGALRLAKQPGASCP